MQKRTLHIGIVALAMTVSAATVRGATSPQNDFAPGTVLVKFNSKPRQGLSVAWSGPMA